MKLGLVDMEANFVPNSGNQLGVNKEQWLSLSPIERLERVLDTISKSDFKYLELGIPWINEQSSSIPLKEVQTILNKNKLKIEAYCSLIPPKMKTVGPDVNTNEIESYLKKVFFNCNKLGGNIIVFGSGASRNIPPNYAKEKAIKDIIKFLILADNIIKKHNYPFKIAIESLNKNESNFINSLKEAYDIALMVDSPNIGVLLDLFHAYRQKVSFWDEINKTSNKLYHIHIAQPEDRKWPGHLKSEGSFDFNRFFKILKDLPYTGNVSVECNFNNLEKEINVCYAFLKEYVT